VEPLAFVLQKKDDTYWYMDRPHFHEGFEILMPLTCGGRIFADRSAWPLRRGLLFVLGNAAPHRNFSQRNISYSRYVLHFQRETLLEAGAGALTQKFAEGSRCIVLDESAFAECLICFQAMEQRENLTELLRGRGAFLRLLALIDERWEQAPGTLTAAGATDPVADSAIAYIRSNLHRSMDLEEVAAACFVSKSALCHRFKSATGFSVGEYIIHSRVLRSRVLLLEGLSVQQAGEQAGFGDNAHFIRTFKKLTGVTPGRYARDRGGEPV